MLVEARKAIEESMPINSMKLETILKERIYEQTKLPDGVFDRIFGDLKDSKVASGLAIAVNRCSIGRELKEFLLLDLCRSQHSLD